jgi:hypothetical protein
VLPAWPARGTRPAQARPPGHQRRRASCSHLRRRRTPTRPPDGIIAEELQPAPSWWRVCKASARQEFLAGRRTWFKTVSPYSCGVSSGRSSPPGYLGRGRGGAGPRRPRPVRYDECSNGWRITVTCSRTTRVDAAVTACDQGWSRHRLVTIRARVVCQSLPRHVPWPCPVPAISIPRGTGGRRLPGVGSVVPVDPPVVPAAGGTTPLAPPKLPSPVPSTQPSDTGRTPSGG